MNDFMDWFQNNAVDLARLLVQCAILATLVRYGRKLLATLRASQEQVGALLRLSVSDAVAERSAPASQRPGNSSRRRWHLTRSQNRSLNQCLRALLRVLVTLRNST